MDGEFGPITHRTQPHKSPSMNILQEHELATQVCAEFNKRFLNSQVRFGRTSKIKERFVGKIDGVTWAHCKRRGGGFYVWIVYGGLGGRPHHAVLRDMVHDYAAHVASLRVAGSEVKNIRNMSVSLPRDLEIEIHGGWVSLGELFPINVRELMVQACNHWLELGP